MRILITGAGGAAAISVWKSLGQEHEIYMADIDPCAAGLYLVPPQQRLIIPRGDASDFIDTLLKLCETYEINVLIATVDSELAPVSLALPRFAEFNIKVPISNYESLKICYDKFQLLTHAQNIIPTPEFLLLNEESFSSIKKFPRFAKPRFGAGSRGVVLIHSQAELAALPRDNSYLVQEYLPGDEYSVDTYLDSHGNPVAAVPRLRMKIDSGIAVASRTEQLPDLSALAIKLAMHLKIHYVSNIQFKRSQTGEFKLLEINPRFSGTLPLTVAAGVDIPKLLMKDIQGHAFPKELMSFKDLMVVRYWTEKYFPVSEWEALCQSG